MSSPIPAVSYKEEVGSTELRAFGTTVTLATGRPEALGRARRDLRAQLDAVDLACSRFRPDSEIWNLYGSYGRPVSVSRLLFELVGVACDVAERTKGAVDPTVGMAIEGLGYDRDFADVVSSTSPLRYEPRPAPGWWQIEMDTKTASVRVPAGIRLDLGATAKAFAADRAAGSLAEDLGCGVLVSIGGDVSVAGTPPAGGWPVGVAVASSSPKEAATRVVSISSGGLASSSTAVRTWSRAGCRLHHIVDPRTGDVAGDHWKLVSVAAGSCLEANAASTASIVWGPEAVVELEAQELPSRLVGNDGAVVIVAGWPAEPLRERRAPRRSHGSTRS